jgi:hypothetical protein
MWPDGCLIALFFGHLNPEQMYLPEAPPLSGSITQAGDIAVASSYNMASGGSSDSGH